MSAAPFYIDTPAGKATAIIGLALLTVQAARLKAWNLVLLNFAGIAGYTFSLIA